MDALAQKLKEWEALRPTLSSAQNKALNNEWDELLRDLVGKKIEFSAYRQRAMAIDRQMMASSLTFGQDKQLYSAFLTAILGAAAPAHIEHELAHARFLEQKGVSYRLGVKKLTDGAIQAFVEPLNVPPARQEPAFFEGLLEAPKDPSPSDRRSEAFWNRKLL